MNLKPQEKRAILAGKHPKIVRPHEGRCPFEVGEEITLKTTRTLNGAIPEVSIRITGHHRHKNGAWEAIYSVRDERGVYVNQGLGYTRSPTRALDPEAPVLDPEVIEEYAMEGQQKTALRSAERSTEQKREGKEARKGSSKRSERAIQRHAKALEASFSRPSRAGAWTTGEKRESTSRIATAGNASTPRSRNPSDEAWSNSPSPAGPAESGD